MVKYTKSDIDQVLAFAQGMGKERFLELVAWAEKKNKVKNLTYEAERSLRAWGILEEASEAYDPRSSNRASGKR